MGTFNSLTTTAIINSSSATINLPPERVIVPTCYQSFTFFFLKPVNRNLVIISLLSFPLSSSSSFSSSHQSSCPLFPIPLLSTSTHLLTVGYLFVATRPHATASLSHSSSSSLPPTLPSSSFLSNFFLFNFFPFFPFIYKW